MKENKPRIGIVGGFQMGKSTLVNCLLDGKFARTGGMGIAVTSVPTRYTFGSMQSVQYMRAGQAVRSCRLHEFLDDIAIPGAIEEIVVTLWKPVLKHIDIIDTPGFKATDKDTATTRDAIRNIDFVIVLLNNKSLDAKEVEIFNFLHSHKKPFIVLVNCVNQGGVLWDPTADGNKKILSEIENRIKNVGSTAIPIYGKNIWCCNLIWYWYASEHYLGDPSLQKERIDAQIIFFTENFLHINKSDYNTLAEKSNFPAFRMLFEEGMSWGFPVNFIRWNAAINQSITEWSNILTQLSTKL